MNCVILALILGQPASPAPPITAAAFAKTGNHVVLGSQAGIQVLSWPDLKPGKGPITDLSHVHDLAFSPDGKSLLAAGGAPAELGAVEVLSWPDLKKIDRIKPHKDLVYRVAWSPDGSRWACASADGTCSVFAAASRKRETTYEGHSRAVLAIAFLPDGKSIVSAGVDQTLQVWDAVTGKMLKNLDNHVASVNDVAVRPRFKPDADPMVVSVSEDRTVRLWQPTTGRLIRFARLKAPPRVVAWSPDGARLLVACNDGRVLVMDPDTLEILSNQRGVEGRIHSLAIHPSEHNLLLGGPGFSKLAW
jgi:WD40 repeat protein